MSKKKILIIGGYGNTGNKIAQLLFKYSDVEIFIAGRSLQKAETQVKKLSKGNFSSRLIALSLDVNNYHQLVEAFLKVDLVVCAVTVEEYIEKITKACFSTQTDFLDLEYSSKKLEYLKSIEDEIKSNNRVFITDCGFHPGLPAAMIRFASLKIGKLVSAKVGSLIKENWSKFEISDNTMQQFAGELADYNSSHFINGKWEKISMFQMSPYVEFDFKKFGKQRCVPMYLEEIKEIVKDNPTIKNVGFYIAGSNWFVDYFVFPVLLIIILLFGKKRSSIIVGKILFWSLKKLSKPPYKTILKLEAISVDNKNFSMEISHEDGYWLTAIPTTACILQYLKNDKHKLGLYTQGNFIEPIEFFELIKKMDVNITES